MKESKPLPPTGSDMELDIERLAALVGDEESVRAGILRRCYAMEQAVRKHRDQRGDDRCWVDDEELYKALPEGYEAPERDCRVELALCERYIASRHHPGTEYVSPQRRIEELEAESALLKWKLEPLKLLDPDKDLVDDRTSKTE